MMPQNSTQPAQPTSSGYKNPIDDATFNNIMKGSVPQYATPKPLSAYDQYLQATAKSPDTSLGGRIQTDVSSRIDQGKAAYNNKNQSDFSKGFQIGGAALGAANDVVGEGIKTIPGIQTAGNALKGLGNIVPGADLVKQGLEGWKQILGSAFDTLQKQHPEALANLQALGNAVQFAGTAVGGKALVDEAPGLVKQGISATSDALGNAATKAKNLISGTSEAASQKLRGKALQDVLATPESEVHKLAPAERSAWFDNQKNQIAESSNAANEQTKAQLQKIDEGKTTMNQQIMQQHQANADALTKQAEDLKNELATTARDKVVELRPKILGAMQEQSQTYRQLVEEGMAGKENVPVDKQALKDFVDSRFGEDPGRAAAIKDRLGLTQTVDPMSTGKVATDLRSSNTTLGKIYEQTKNLKQDLGAAARKGTRVFTSDEKLTDDAINTLSSYMKGQGVDLGAANQFWSKYAPIRNQLVTEAKPFLQTGTNTKTFANTLMRVAKGVDVNNENFINEVENMLGEPITKEVKDVVAKLDTNEKQALANQVDTEMKKAQNEVQTQRLRQPVEESQVENKKSTGEKQQNLSDRQFAVEQEAADRAKIKSIISKVLWTLGGGFAGGEIVRHL